GYAAMAADDEEGLSILVDTFEANAAAYIAKGYALGDYTYDRYKSDAEGTDGAVTLVGAGNGSRDLFESDLVHLVAGVSLARNLGNAPGNAIYPETFIDTVRTAFRGTGNVSFRVLNPRDMERRGMGALLGVGQGSVREPRLLVITYSGGPRDAAPLALVGKGVTFDTGGISLKESDTMWRMKADLSGAAAVAGAVLAAAKRRAPLNLVGVMPLAENMPGANAIRPGDVLTTSSGKTIEILNTDAEGRLILADAITYTQTEFDPYMLLNIATLTGSAARATGDEYGAVMTRDFALSTEMMDIGEAAGEPVWPLPLHPNHFDQIVSDVADIKNLGGSPGASTAAALVGSFVDEDRPWVHLDMAGVFFADGSVPGYPKGHAGWGVRFMDTLVRRESE
ncbi:MAG: leucyl aminopeptidase family protein, partial [Pseudomonadota bacterium]